MEVERDDGIDVYCILEEDSIRLTDALVVECGGGGKAEIKMTPRPDLSNDLSLPEMRKPGRNSFCRRRVNWGF